MSRDPFFEIEKPVGDNGLLMGVDGKLRCSWVGSDPLYCAYHDNEWGKVIFDDRLLFEKICLEGFQAGLSWLTILKKILHFRNAFDHFDLEKIVCYDEEKIKKLLQDRGIVRHQGKIRSVINNAFKAQTIIAEWGSLFRYFWSFQALKHGSFEKESLQIKQGNSATFASIHLAKDLKKRGWTFVGPEICHSFMQAVGIINGHLDGCFCRQESKGFCYEVLS
ncbi:DNA-3-methyladenine glycosylase [Bartonella ancashensis]|uniref:DNA-3-methyladenine glycosylase n=2 Tax=Bartonella ancashensis TaxID=1318743 RepID=A0A0M4L6Y3_9HYPH|nr:DNA-3-methyladenine glycosylase [Bartonella ancashensis]